MKDTSANQAKHIEITNKTINAASSEAKDLLSEAFRNVKEAASGGGSDPTKPDKFFPFGIELIYVKVEAALTEKTKVTVELKIAGEKGIKGTFTESEPEGKTEQSPDKGE